MYSFHLEYGSFYYNFQYITKGAMHECNSALHYYPCTSYYNYVTIEIDKPASKHVRKIRKHLNERGELCWKV